MAWIEVRWPDGSITFGESAEAVIERVAEVQWQETTVERMRNLLSDRTWVLFGIAIAPDLPAEDFLQALHSAGMLSIIKWDTDNIVFEGGSS